MRTKDYTAVPVGTKMDRGQIEVCPQCGKNALAARINDMTFYTHTVGIKMNEDGSTEIIEESHQVRETHPESAEPK